MGGRAEKRGDHWRQQGGLVPRGGPWKPLPLPHFGSNPLSLSPFPSPPFSGTVGWEGGDLSSLSHFGQNEFSPTS